MSALPQPLAGEVAALLDGLPEDIAGLATDLVALLLHLRPELTPRVRTGWRSINFRHPTAGFLCAVFPHPDRVALVFEHGRQLSDPEGLLAGDGRQVRFVRLVPGQDLPESGIGLLLAEAIALRG